MTRLILTSDGSGAGALLGAGRADIVISLERRLVWGPPPADAELVAFLAPRTTQRPDSHWLDYISPGHLKHIGGKDLGLLEMCQRCETVELWMETEPNAQLLLIWLLDYLRSHAKAATNLALCHVDAPLGDANPEQLAKWQFPVVRITSEHFKIASLAWRAYHAPTPQTWFNLLSKDLSILPQLRRCVVEMLEELPGRATGLGASEMRILELISAGYMHPFDVFPQAALSATCVWLLGGRLVAGRTGACSGTRRVRACGVAIYTRDAQRARPPRAIQEKQAVTHRIRQGDSRLQGRLQPP